MTRQTFDLNQLRVASPCSVPWASMTGDGRARHCDSCQLNVYNIAELSRAEVENLVATREGRLCIRLYKRADGTVITKDCPVGLRAYQKRVARFAGAALTAILGLFSVSFGQKDDKKAIDAAKLKIMRTVSQNSALNGTITDPNGALVPNAEILLFKGKREIGRVKSDENGHFAFASLAPGLYALEVKADGFVAYKVKNIKIGNNESSGVDISLNVDNETVVVGIYVCDSSGIDTRSTTVQTTITRDMMNKIPH